MIEKEPLTSRGVSPRVLGTVGMLASPMVSLQGPLTALLGEAGSTFRMGLCSLLYVLGWLCSTLGLRMLRATGDGLLARVVFYVQLVGLGLATLWAAQYVVNPGLQERTGLIQVTDAAWPLSHIFMLVVGGLVIAAKRFHGWRRLPFFLCGLAVPVHIVLSGLGAPGPAMSLGFPLFSTLGFFLLGLSVRTAADKPR
jgi:hypothetical protein